MKLSPKWVVLIGVLSVSVSPLLSKAAEAPPDITAFYRLLFTVVLMLLMKPAAVWKDLRAIPFRDGFLCWASGFFLALHFYAWIASLQLTSVASSTVLVSMHPPIMLGLAWLLFQEKPTRSQAAAVGLTVLGSSLLALEDWGRGQESLAGDLLALLGALFVVFYLALGKSARERLSNHQYTLHTYLSCTLTLLVIALLQGSPFTGYAPKEYLIFLALAIFPTLLGHTLFNWALAYVSPTLISVSVLGEPVVASLLAWVLFSEPIGLLQGTGGAVILGGIWWYSQVKQTEAKNGAEG